jgi:hypothetical protein
VIAITAASPTRGSSFASIDAMPNGQVRLVLNTQPGKTYAIQTSTNLINWVQIISRTADGNTISFVETNSPAVPHRFFRTVEF